MVVPLATGKKSRMLSVFTPRLGLRGMSAGLIRRSCMSHFTHTTCVQEINIIEKTGNQEQHQHAIRIHVIWIMTADTAGLCVGDYVCVCDPYLERDCLRSSAAAGGGAPFLLPALEATPSRLSPRQAQCFPPAAGQPLFPT